MSRLLVFDDEKFQQEGIREAALEAGFGADSIVVLGRLEDADALLDTPFEIAVVDINLGVGLDEAGIDFIKDLHTRQPNCKILAFSTKRDNLSGIRAMASGAVDYVSGRWRSISWRTLLTEKLGIYKALIEGTDLLEPSSNP